MKFNAKKFNSNAIAAKKKLTRPAMETIEGRTMFSTYTVTTTADSGTGSFRDAIKAANNNSGADTINFKISASDALITLSSQLPQVTGQVTIDATTQPGYAGKPLVRIDGVKSGGYGLVIRGGNSTVKGLDITRFATGILILDGGNNTVKGNYIGIDRSGNLQANSDKGIIVQSANNVIGGSATTDRNVISGNKNSGIQFFTTAAKGNQVYGNYIGTNLAGTGAIANGNGIAIAGGANNIIGGTSSAQRNVISGNTGDGIVVSMNGATGNLIQGNYIGVNAAGSGALGNGTYGVEVSQPNNTVGGTSSSQRNVISANGWASTVWNIGVVLWLSTANHCKVIGNYVGTDATGTKALGNTGSGIMLTDGTTDNTISGNLVSGNKVNGIEQYLGTRNTISGNTVGLSSSGAAMGNGHDGIQFLYATNSSAFNNTVGYNGASGISKIGSSGITQYSNTIISDTLYGF